MNKMYLVLGDWSGNGHGKCSKVLIEANKTVTEIQQAYKDSCKLTGISFNGNDDYTKTGKTWEEAGQYKIAVEYENDKLYNEVLEVLRAFKCPEELIKRYEYEAMEAFVDLWFWFIGLSLIDIDYTELMNKNDTPVINGFHNKNLNHQFGYGLYT